jgi:hypothetical protein
LVPLRLIYIPSKLFVHGNATATANNIAPHETLSISIAGDLFTGTMLIFVAVILGGVLSPGSTFSTR